MTKKTKAVTKTANDNKTMRLELAELILNNVAKTYNLSKKLQIGVTHDMGLTSEDAAIIVKTSANYVRNVIGQIRRDSKLRQRLAEIIGELPDWYRSACKARLPLLAAAEAKAVEKYLESPELLIDKPQLAKQIKSAAGVKTDEEAQVKFVPVNVAIQVQNIFEQHELAHAAGTRAKAIDVVPTDENDIT